MLLYKNMMIQIMKNKVFVVLLWILTILTSLSYFFVKFSIDGNMEMLQKKAVLQENELLWENALKSNTTLANIFLVSATLLTCFVFFMFFYRFFRANKIQLGCVKALGMKDRELCICFCGFSIVLSLTGGVVGVGIGYVLSEVLLQAYVQSYCVAGVIKGIHKVSILLGVGVPALSYCGITLLCFLMIKGKEPGVLLAGRVPYKKLGKAFSMADRIAKLIPAKEKFPFRIAFRKPVAIILMFFAILFFQTCVILGQSLNLSSQKIMQSQMQGHNYLYDTRLDQVTDVLVTDGEVPYLYQECEVILSNKQEAVSQTIIGLYEKSDLYILYNGSWERKEIPLTDEVYINSGLADMYGISHGDELMISVDGKEKVFLVADVLQNAKSASIYCNAEELATLMGYKTGSYNGLWSMERPELNGIIESMEQRIERLEHDAVSNRLSAVINQLTGVVIGIILLFLALFLNFQDNQRDMDILKLIGYQNREIRKLFVDIYWPIVLVFFVIGIIPSIMLAQAIQRGLSLAIQDYMPFGMNLKVFLLMFLIMNVIYGCVWSIFTRKMKNI